MKGSLYIVLAALLFLTGCSTRAGFRGEEFKEESPFMRNFPVSSQKACESAQMALLSQGYRISQSSPTSATGQKDFQAENETFAAIEIKMVCMDRGQNSIVFASALQTRFELKKSRQSTSLDIPVVGAISLPMGTQPESLVNVGSETISDWEFYSSLFDLVRTFLE